MKSEETLVVDLAPGDVLWLDSLGKLSPRASKVCIGFWKRPPRNKKP